jgi:hypothetical protein
VLVADGRLEDNQGLGTGDLAAAAKLINNMLELLHITNADPGEGIRIAGYGEDGLDLSDVWCDVFDIVDSGTPAEAQLDKRLEGLADTRLIDDCRIRLDYPFSFEAIDAAFNRGGR